MRKVLSNHFLNVLVFILFSNFSFAQFPTIYASVASGTWSTLGNWETFTGNATNTPGAQGTGTAATSAPSGTHHIYIRAGHTITMGASKNAMGITVEATGSLLAGGSYTLKPGNGGTGFTGPNNVTIQNEGTIGGGSDVITLEVPVAAGTVNINGNGTYNLGRIRIVGNNQNSPVVNINANLNLVQTGNYALSAIYNPTATDNYTINIAAGKTVTVSGVTGYFNNNSIGSGSGWGTYTYNLNGTLNLSASTQTATNLTAFSPLGGTVNFNINGPVVTGAAFNSSPVAPGVSNILVANGTTVDARLATVMNFNGNAFILGGANAKLQRTVNPDGAKVEFPIGTSSASFTGVTISGSTGPAETFTANVTNTITNTAPANTLLKEWTIEETVAGGNEDTLRFAWTIADEGASGFSGANPVFVGRWNGTAYEFTAASVSGTGVAADPYVAKAFGFTSFGKFILSNSGNLPVRFTNLSAVRNAGKVTVRFTNATELDVVRYVIERSADGRDFSSIGSLNARSNNASSSSYSFEDIQSGSQSVFYRIRAFEAGGTEIISPVMKVSSTRNGTSGISIYPNPVQSQSFQLSLQQLPAANYSIQVINAQGQKVYTQSLQLNGEGQVTQQIQLPASIASGNYMVRVANATSVFIERIVIQ